MKTTIRALCLSVVAALAICASACVKPPPDATGNEGRGISDPIRSFDPDVPTEEAF